MKNETATKLHLNLIFIDDGISNCDIDINAKRYAQSFREASSESKLVLSTRGHAIWERRQRSPEEYEKWYQELGYSDVVWTGSTGFYHEDEEIEGLLRKYLFNEIKPKK